MAAQWVEEEFETLDLGDQRLDERAKNVLDAWSSKPNASTCKIYEGRHKDMEALYRLFVNKKVDFHKLLEPHIQKSLERISQENVVLLIQDTTDVNLKRPKRQVFGVGTLNRTCPGVRLHVLHAFTTDGVPLGTVDVQIINRVDDPSSANNDKNAGTGDPDKAQADSTNKADETQANKADNAQTAKTAGADQSNTTGNAAGAEANQPNKTKAKAKAKSSKANEASDSSQNKKDLKHIPIEEKESMRWLDFARKAREYARMFPHVKFVYVCDSEADIYEILSEDRGEIPVHFLIRACQDRAVADSQKHIWETVFATEVLYELELKVRGRDPLISNETRGRRQPRLSRKATVQVRAGTVTLRPPWRHDRKLPPVTLNVVLVNEGNPPDNDEPVEWMLLTTLPIDTADEIKTVVEYYCQRWNIEIFFKILKSGCGIEKRQFRKFKSYEAFMAMCLIMGWRTFYVTRMGRECPDLDCEVIFDPSEWKPVWMKITGKDEDELPSSPPTLGEMVRMVAQLGGHEPKKNTHPGPQTVWEGLRDMKMLSWAWNTFGPGKKPKRQAKAA